ncbi:MAG: tRNA (cytidine(34)-2'-O)-methyltransferase [Eubacterium sp.]|nr:tRNA (cytidine(34)-2'-O)-methyltransferase [Eubacterium sp.]
MLNIVLLEPEIPQNTGNIGRTCVAIGASLHLIEPMGFSVSDKWVRRAGLDYWDQLNVRVYDSYPDFLLQNFPDMPSAGHVAVTDSSALLSDHASSAELTENGGKSIQVPRIYMATTKSRHIYTEPSYEPDCYIMFGKESAGIPEEILVDHGDTTIRIPMMGDIRSLNLSNSVAIVAYEVMRQWGFDGFTTEGALHRLEWID